MLTCRDAGAITEDKEFLLANKYMMMPGLFLLQLFCGCQNYYYSGLFDLSRPGNGIRSGAVAFRSKCPVPGYWLRHTFPNPALAVDDTSGIFHFFRP